jgi:hypothetical protein
MTAGASLLESVQSLLERTYRMRSGVLDVGRFVIGDEGLRTLYAGRTIVPTVEASSPAGAKTLVRECEEGLHACIYYPDELIERLETHPPQQGVDERNVDEFATLVEELDHLLVVAERASDGRPTSLFELELHANVSKHLVLARFLSRGGRPLGALRSTWLRYHLFHKGVPGGEDESVRERYHEASRWALRLLDAAARQPLARRVAALRSFHAANAAGKLELIRSLSG